MGDAYIMTLFIISTSCEACHPKVSRHKSLSFFLPQPYILILFSLKRLKWNLIEHEPFNNPIPNNSFFSQMLVISCTIDFDLSPLEVTRLLGWLIVVMWSSMDDKTKPNKTYTTTLNILRFFFFFFLGVNRLFETWVQSKVLNWKITCQEKNDELKDKGTKKPRRQQLCDH
jgi:hypothetical protein